MVNGALALDWQARAPGETLAAGEIHLWAVNLKGAADAEPSLLTAPELARGARLRNRQRRAMYFGGRCGLRRLLCAYTGLRNDELRLGEGARGKPALLNRLPGGELGFNYSLSGGWALYALGWNRQLGIDLEALPRRINTDGLARRILGASERRGLAALPADRRDLAMLGCWTRKEAYGKALGVGIRYHLHQAAVCVDLHAPRWQCGVRGLFEPQAQPNTRTLHGIQLAPPFPGIAALVYDGEALAAHSPGARQWRLADITPQ